MLITSPVVMGKEEVEEDTAALAERFYSNQYPACHKK
jgi:hypothetical protein